jgi:hypothetical protein
MAVSTEIVRSWRSPRAALRRQIAAGLSEARALAYLMAACGLIFVAQWPRLSREAYLDPAVPLEARVAGALQGIVFLLPLLFYGLAALSHLLARQFGGRGGWLGARVALFWSLLAAAPLFLLDGLVAGFIGPGPARTATGALLAGGLLLHWALALAEAERIAPLEAGGERP